MTSSFSPTIYPCNAIFSHFNHSCQAWALSRLPPEIEACLTHLSAEPSAMTPVFPSALSLSKPHLVSAVLNFKSWTFQEKSSGESTPPMLWWKNFGNWCRIIVIFCFWEGSLEQQTQNPEATTFFKGVQACRVITSSLSSCDLHQWRASIMCLLLSRKWENVDFNPVGSEVIGFTIKNWLVPFYTPNLGMFIH